MGSNRRGRKLDWGGGDGPGEWEGERCLEELGRDKWEGWMGVGVNWCWDGTRGW